MTDKERVEKWLNDGDYDECPFPTAELIETSGRCNSHKCAKLFPELPRLKEDNNPSCPCWELGREFVIERAMAYVKGDFDEIR